MATHTLENTNLERGTAVLSQDGERLGTVAEVVDGTFKVDAPRARDYWLALDLIAEAAPGQVLLSFDAGQLEHFRLDEPARVRAASPMLDEQLDALPGDANRARTREAMERGGSEPAPSELRVDVDESVPAYRRPGTGGGGAPD